MHLEIKEMSAKCLRSQIYIKIAPLPKSYTMATNSGLAKILQRTDDTY